MDINQAAVFLSGSILTMMGFIVVVVGILVINNLIAKYWKSWGWQWHIFPESHSARFLTEEEVAKVAPTLDEKNK
jgi:hypothetical protein